MLLLPFLLEFLPLSVTSKSRQRGLFTEFSVKSFCQAYQQSKQCAVYLALHVSLCSWMCEHDTDSARVRGFIPIRASLKTHALLRAAASAEWLYIAVFGGRWLNSTHHPPTPTPSFVYRLICCVCWQQRGIRFGSVFASHFWIMITYTRMKI